jgi:hypothetical protein
MQQTPRHLAPSKLYRDREGYNPHYIRVEPLNGGLDSRIDFTYRDHGRLRRPDVPCSVVLSSDPLEQSWDAVNSCIRRELRAGRRKIEPNCSGEVYSPVRHF